MKSHPRLLTTGALAATAIVASVTALVAALPGVAAEKAADDSGSLVESFDYPGGAKIEGASA
ncbi:hypothetical protein [Actinoplanes sp. NPDC051859]|uniref:hypothetical protein n=1 Tax=Actinoplanes sp. NPDC051859 TaxID=3363909 RepID=UPI00378EEEE6